MAITGLLIATPAPAAPGVLASRQLLEQEGLAVGDTIRLSVDPAGEQARSFEIVGSYEPVPDPLRLASPRLEIRMHLPDMLELTDDGTDPNYRESVTTINVALEDPDDAWAYTDDLNFGLPGISAFPTGQDDSQSHTFVVLERFHLAIALITVLGSSAFLLALMLMRADERRETVGILRLIGLSRRRVLLEVFLEGLIIAVVGAAFGVLLAGALQGMFNAFFQWRYDTGLIFLRVTPTIAMRCVALAVPLGVLAGVLASWGLLRREILELIRR